MPSHPDRVRRNYVGYAPPANRFERWRDRTWPRWAIKIWPIRRGAIVPITYDRYAGDTKMYFLASTGIHVLDGTSIRRIGDKLT